MQIIYLYRFVFEGQERKRFGYFIVIEGVNNDKVEKVGERSVIIDGVRVFIINIYVVFNLLDIFFSVGNMMVNRKIFVFVEIIFYWRQVGKYK